MPSANTPAEVRDAADVATAASSAKAAATRTTPRIPGTARPRSRAGYSRRKCSKDQVWSNLKPNRWWTLVVLTNVNADAPNLVGWGSPHRLLFLTRPLAIAAVALAGLRLGLRRPPPIGCEAAAGVIALLKLALLTAADKPFVRACIDQLTLA